MTLRTTCSTTGSGSSTSTRCSTRSWSKRPTSKSQLRWSRGQQPTLLRTRGTSSFLQRPQAMLLTRSLREKFSSTPTLSKICWQHPMSRWWGSTVEGQMLLSKKISLKSRAEKNDQATWHIVSKLSWIIYWIQEIKVCNYHQIHIKNPYKQK